VVDVPSNDILNIRAYPASTSRILVGYPNGTPLSLTGRGTGGDNIGDINGLPAWKQRRIVRFVSPDGRAWAGALAYRGPAWSLTGMRVAGHARELLLWRGGRHAGRSEVMAAVVPAG